MHDKLEYYANKYFTPPVPPFVPTFTEFVRVPHEMRDWVETQLHEVGKACSVLTLNH